MRQLRRGIASSPGGRRAAIYHYGHCWSRDRGDHLPHGNELRGGTPRAPLLVPTRNADHVAFIASTDQRHDRWFAVGELPSWF